MDGSASDKTVLFAGDLDDPWVTLIVESISRVAVVKRVMTRDAIPVRLWDANQAPQLLVLHRSRLSPADIARIADWAQAPCSKHIPPRILCYGPYVLYGALERCSQLVDRMLPEASAIDILPRHVLHLLDANPVGEEAPARGRLSVDVRSSDYELRSALIDACSAFGFAAEKGPNSSAEIVGEAELAHTLKPPPRVAVWDVPVLETGWPEEMKRMSRFGPVVALLGFADRANVGLARASGASACLGTPFDLDDLVFVLDRIGQELAHDRSLANQESARAESPHVLPPPPASRASRGRRAIRGRESTIPLWSNEGTAPRMNPDRSS
jgi:hypothetical protein